MEGTGKPGLLDRIDLCFNGATTVKSWKGRITPPCAIRNCGLQWSHDGEVVEGIKEEARLLRDAMLQWSHDGEIVEGGGTNSYRLMRPRRFNGATTVKSWKGPGL